MAARIAQRMRAALARRESAGTLRTTTFADAPLIDFASNDYLGIARDAAVAEAHLVEELRRHATEPRANGSTGSRLLSGACGAHDDFEAWLATFHGREGALLFGSGYAANAAALATLPQPGDLVLFDELSHNSSRFGLARGRQAASAAFAHNDAAAAARALAEFRENAGPGPSALVAVEAVYSMDGDEAPLAALADACLADGNACLVVDEAHATGLLGPGGRGACAALDAGLRAAVLAQVHTFGKAVGCHGAAVLGDAATREYLANYAQPFIYSTAPPPGASRLARRCYGAFAGPAGDARRAAVARLVDLFKRELGTRAARLVPSATPIQALLVPGAGRVQDAAAAIRDRGFDVRPIRAPTVPAGAERLRVILHAHNTEAEVRGLAAAIRDAVDGEDRLRAA